MAGRARITLMVFGLHVFLIEVTISNIKRAFAWEIDARSGSPEYASKILTPLVAGDMLFTRALLPFRFTRVQR